MTEVFLMNSVVLVWMSLDLTNDKPTLVQVMAWCCQQNYYKSQCCHMASLGHNELHSNLSISLFFVSYFVSYVFRIISLFPNHSKFFAQSTTNIPPRIISKTTEQLKYVQQTLEYWPNHPNIAYVSKITNTTKAQTYIPWRGSVYPWSH